MAFPLLPLTLSRCAFLSLFLALPPRSHLLARLVFTCSPSPFPRLSHSRVLLYPPILLPSLFFVSTLPFPYSRYILPCFCCPLTPCPLHCPLAAVTPSLSPRYLIIENFIPPEEKNKIMNRLYFECEEDQWKFQPLVPAGGYGHRLGTAVSLLG